VMAILAMPSVHPPALAAVFFLAIVWRAEVAVFIEVLFRVMLVFAHVDLEPALGTATLPAMVRIPHAEVAFRKPKDQTSPGKKFQVQEAEQRSSKMSNVSRSARVTHRPRKSNQDQDAHHVFGFHSEREGE